MSMDAPYASADDAAPRRDLPGLLVPPAMLVAAAAMGIASHLHLGVTVEVAVAIGVSLFCLMLMCHVLLRAAEEADRAEDEAAQRRFTPVASPMPVPPSELRHPAATVSEPTAGTALPAASLEQDGPTQTSAPPVAPAFAPALPEQAPQQQPPAWAFRPVDLQLPTVEADPSVGSQPRDPAAFSALRPTISEHGTLDGTGTARPVSRESERIDVILKRLAAQIQAGTAIAPADFAAAAPAPAAAPVPDAEVPTAERVALAEAMAAVAASSPAPDTSQAEVAPAPDQALDTAVDALRATVAAMRGSPEAEPAVPPAAAPAAPMATPAELRIAAVAEALAAERADVFLSPILGLASEQARHFEVSVQLRAAAGEVLEARDTAAGAGLLPLLDALGVRHAAGFALMLERRGREGTVFSRVGGSSLENEQFVADVAGRHAQGIADRMVLSFAQDEMRGLGPAQLDALGDLGRLGFRFALQGVADLDMDFEALAALGFEFVKLDAQVFQRGLVCGGAEIPASDICRHFEDLGLSVIVSGIADQITRDRLMGCGVVFGQGPLFGAPRPVPVTGAARTLAA